MTSPAMYSVVFSSSLSAAACASGTIKAGNDVLMPGSPTDHDDLMNALNNDDARYPVTRAQLEKCASRLIELARLLTEQAEG